MAELINPLAILLQAQKAQSDIQAQRDLSGYRGASLALDREKMSQADRQFNEGMGLKREGALQDRARFNEGMKLKREALMQDLMLKRSMEKPVIVRDKNGKLVWARPDQAVGMEAGNINGKVNPQLPTQAVKLQNDLFEDISTASNSEADLQALHDQIQNGTLKLGIVQNALSSAKNNLGLSDENSRNYQTFDATLQKLRNDSLRLNKGVQTEGDAQRAWQELIANKNDPENVKQRLKEIAQINRRAAGQKKAQLHQLRSNFGVGDMDLSAFEKPAAAIGGGGGWSVQEVK